MRSSGTIWYITIISLSFFSCNTAGEPVQENQTLEAVKIIPSIPEQFLGVWTGSSGSIRLDNITPESGDVISAFLDDMLIYISKNNITEYVLDFEDDDELPYREITPEKEYLLNAGSHLIYTWLNSGGVWSETQVFSFSINGENGLSATWNRHVNNEIKNDNNDVWNIQNILRFSRHNENEENSPAKEIVERNKKQEITNGLINNNKVDNRFSGSWGGVIDSNNGRQDIYIKLEVSNNEAAIFMRNKNVYEIIRPRFYHYDFLGNNFIYTLINIDSKDTYSETYSFSIINDDILGVVFSRHYNRGVIWGEGQLKKTN